MATRVCTSFDVRVTSIWCYTKETIIATSLGTNELQELKKLKRTCSDVKLRRGMLWLWSSELLRQQFSGRQHKEPCIWCVWLVKGVSVCIDIHTPQVWEIPGSSGEEESEVDYSVKLNLEQVISTDRLIALARLSLAVCNFLSSSMQLSGGNSRSDW
jgi:hypothetical protein